MTTRRKLALELGYPYNREGKRGHLQVAESLVSLSLARSLGIAEDAVPSTCYLSSTVAGSTLNPVSAHAYGKLAKVPGLINKIQSVSWHEMSQMAWNESDREALAVRLLNNLVKMIYSCISKSI